MQAARGSEENCVALLESTLIGFAKVHDVCNELADLRSKFDQFPYFLSRLIEPVTAGGKMTDVMGAIGKVREKFTMHTSVGEKGKTIRTIVLNEGAHPGQGTMRVQEW